MKDWTRRHPEDPCIGTRGSPTEMQKFLKWIPLAERRARSKVALFYKIINEGIDINNNILSKNNRNTRHNILKYNVITTRLNAYHHSYFPSTTLLWNALPGNIANAPSLEAFKSRLAKITLLPNASY